MLRLKSSRVISRSSTTSPFCMSSKYQRFSLARTLSTRLWLAWSRAWMAANTAAPCSIRAWVVPTGACAVTSAIFSSAVVITPLAAFSKKPISENNTGLGALKGRGMAILRTSSTPGAPSISTTWVTSTCWLCPLILPPLSFSMVGALLIWAESNKALREPVRAAAKPPMRWGNPTAYAPRHGMNLNSISQSSLDMVSSPSSQLRYRPMTLLSMSSIIKM